MSYDIVKNIKIMQNENGSYYARITSASSNVTPAYYFEYDYCKSYNFNKEQLEKELLLDFYKGNLQKGSSKYKKAVENAEYKQNLFVEVKRISKVLTKATNRYLAIKENSKRKEEISKLIDKLYNLYDEEVKEVLYKELYNNDKIKGLVIYDKYTNSYVSKILTKRYYASNAKQVITNKNTINKVLYGPQAQWWQDNFEVEVIK